MDSLNKKNIQNLKMNLFGEMLSDITHQWKQPLSVISFATSALNLKNDLNTLDKKESAVLLKIITENVSFMSNTIDTFSNFINDKNEEKEYFYLHNLMKEVTFLINPIFKINFIKYKIIEHEDILLDGYKNDFLQILLNISINIKDVLVKKTIDILGLILVDIKKEDSNIIIKIKDNAGEVSDDVIDKIFNKYFTTKEKDNRTSLGLYMCKQIIEKKMKGNIEASNVEYSYSNKIYKGLEFKLIFPIKPEF